MLEVEGVEVWEEYSEHQREDILEKVKLFWEETLCETIFFTRRPTIKIQRTLFCAIYTVPENAFHITKSRYFDKDPAILISFLEK